MPTRCGVQKQAGMVWPRDLEHAYGELVAQIRAEHVNADGAIRCVELSRAVQESGQTTASKSVPELDEKPSDEVEAAASRFLLRIRGAGASTSEARMNASKDSTRPATRCAREPRPSARRREGAG